MRLFSRSLPRQDCKCHSSGLYILLCTHTNTLSTHIHFDILTQEVYNILTYSLDFFSLT